MKIKLSALILLFCFNLSIQAQTVTKLSTDQFKFIEGPVWDGDDLIYFSDVAAKKVYTYSVSKNAFTLAFDNNAGGCNGLMFDKDYNLIVCEFHGGNIAKRKVSGELINMLTTGYNNIPFDNPNDLCIDKKGGIYFTDPTDKASPGQESRRIYYITPQGELTIAEDGKGYVYPNGVIISPDGKTLYANDSTSHDIYKYDIDEATAAISNKTLFTTLTNANDGNPKSRADGMALDTEGNLYITSKLTIQIFNNKGEAIGVLNFPEPATNCSFGNHDKKTLYVTATKNLYSVDLTKTGFQHPFDLK